MCGRVLCTPRMCTTIISTVMISYPSVLLTFVKLYYRCGAQHYRALVMILQYHKSLSMIGYPNVVSHVFQSETSKSCLLNNPYISHFNAYNFLFYMLRKMKKDAMHACKQSFTPPKRIMWDIKCTHASAGRNTGIVQLHNFCRRT